MYVLNNLFKNIFIKIFIFIIITTMFCTAQYSVVFRSSFLAVVHMVNLCRYGGEVISNFCVNSLMIYKSILPTRVTL